jgi:RNA polymerase sigma-70 factor (ECF subfamily)
MVSIIKNGITSGEKTALIRRAMSGDADAFEDLYRMYTSDILYHCRGMLNNKSDVEDAAQEVVLRLFRSIRNLKSPYAFYAYLYRTVRNTCSTFNTKDKSAMQTDIDDLEIELQPIAEERSEAPQDAIEDLSEQEEIARFIATLPEKQRTAIYLHYYKGMSYKEVGKIMNITVATVGTNIMRGKSKLKKMLEKNQSLNALIFGAIDHDVSKLVNDVRPEQFFRVCDEKIVKAVSLAKAPVSHATSAATHSVHTAHTAHTAHVAHVGTIASGVTAKAVAIVVTVSAVATSGAVVGSQVLHREALSDRPAVVSELAPEGAPNAASEGTPQDAETALPGVETELPDTETVPLVPFTPYAEIVMVSDGVSAGQNQPTDAELKLAGGEALAWRITDAEGRERLSGAGQTLADEFKTLAPGEYTLIWDVSDGAGAYAEVQRTFIIVE